MGNILLESRYNSDNELTNEISSIYQNNLKIKEISNKFKRNSSIETNYQYNDGLLVQQNSIERTNKSEILLSHDIKYEDYKIHHSYKFTDNDTIVDGFEQTITYLLSDNNPEIDTLETINFNGMKITSTYKYYKGIICEINETSLLNDLENNSKFMILNKSDFQ